MTKEVLLSLETLLTVSVLIETSFGVGLKLSLNEVTVIRRLYYRGGVRKHHQQSRLSLTVTDAIWTPLTRADRCADPADTII